MQWMPPTGSNCGNSSTEGKIIGSANTVRRARAARRASWWAVTISSSIAWMRPTANRCGLTKRAIISTAPARWPAGRSSSADATPGACAVRGPTAPGSRRSTRARHIAASAALAGNLRLFRPLRQRVSLRGYQPRESGLALPGPGFSLYVVGGGDGGPRAFWRTGQDAALRGPGRRQEPVEISHARKNREFAGGGRGKVVFGSDDGTLYVVSLQEGKQLWSYEIGQAVASSPAVADEKIVIGSDDGSVYCFGQKNGVTGL